MALSFKASTSDPDIYSGPFREEAETVNDSPMSAPPPKSAYVWTHTVLFEPQPKVRLTRSTFKVTSFIDFSPYIASFENLRLYLDAYGSDLNSQKTKRAFVKRGEEMINFNFNLSHPSRRTFAMILHSVPCRKHPEQCEHYLRLHRFKQEYLYMSDLFDAIYAKFLSAIDHVDYHPSYRITREALINKSRSAMHRRYRPNSQYTDFEELDPRLIKALLKFLEKENPPLHRSLSRMKRFGLDTFLLGWGIFTNANNIRKIKKDIRKLQAQNDLQDTQIRALAGYLNLTAAKVNRQQDMLYEIDVRLTAIEKTVTSILIDHELSTRVFQVFTELLLRSNRLESGLMAMQQNVESFYEYLRVLASRQANPLVIPPDKLRNILVQVKDDMKTNLRLALPEDPDLNIFSYYSIIKLTPIVFNDFLMLVLTIPLVDTSLSMNLYKVHNLPMLHPVLNIQATYILEGTYLAVLVHGLYAAIPNEMDIRICMATKGYICILNSALYPVDRIQWCLYALFINDPVRINANCKFQTEVAPVNTAYSLGNHLWAISTPTPINIQIKCLMDTYVETIRPPLKFLEIGDGCEGYTDSIYIPATSELSKVHHDQRQVSNFISFDTEYYEVDLFIVWYYFEIQNLTEDELAKIRSECKKLAPMDMDQFKSELYQRLRISDQSSFTFPSWLIPVGLGLSLIICLVLVVGYFYVKKKGLAALIPTDKIPSFLQPILSQLNIPMDSPKPTGDDIIPSTTNREPTPSSALVPIHSIETPRVPSQTVVQIHMDSSHSPSDSDTEPPPEPQRSELSFSLFRQAAEELSNEGYELRPYYNYLRRHRTRLRAIDAPTLPPKKPKTPAPRP